ncbi:MAG: DUF3343 domain-containing protein [Lachnospiraceae bacterium]
MELILTFKNTNYAIQAEQTLLERGVKVKVMPLPSVIRAGCGICLRITEENGVIAQQILEEIGVSVEEIYTSNYVIWGGQG